MFIQNKFLCVPLSHSSFVACTEKQNSNKSGNKASVDWLIYLSSYQIISFLRFDLCVQLDFWKSISHVQKMANQLERFPDSRLSYELCHNDAYINMCTCAQACLHVCYTLVFLAEDAFCFVGVSICATHWVKLFGASSRFILVALRLYTHANRHHPSADI